MQVRPEDAQRMKALEQEAAAALKECEKLRGSAGGLHAQADRLQQAIADAGGPPLKKQRVLVAQTQEVGMYHTNGPKSANLVRDGWGPAQSAKRAVSRDDVSGAVVQTEAQRHF